MITYFILTGFKKFCNYKINPSEIIVDRIKHPNILNKFVVDVSVRDVDYYISLICKITKKLSLNNRIIILHIGLDFNSDQIILEHGAVNQMTFGCKDNNNFMPKYLPIDPRYDILNMLYTDIPIYSLFPNISKREYGGTFVSNYIYYSSLMNCKSKNKVDSLYIHIPFYFINESENKIIEIMNSLTNYYRDDSSLNLKKYKLVL